MWSTIRNSGRAGQVGGDNDGINGLRNRHARAAAGDGQEDVFEAGPGPAGQRITSGQQANLMADAFVQNRSDREPSVADLAELQRFQESLDDALQQACTNNERGQLYRALGRSLAACHRVGPSQDAFLRAFMLG